MIGEEQYELIERYHQGELTEDERQNLEQRIGQDPEMQKLSRQIKALIDVSRVNRLDEAMNTLKSIEKQTKEKTKGPQPAKPRQLKWLIPLAAAIAAFALIYNFLLARPQLDPLYAEHIELLPSRSEKAVTDDILDEAYSLYSFQKYRKAARLFNQAVEAGKSKENLIYAASAYMELRQFNKANTILESLESESTIYTEVSRLQALAILQLQGREAAKTYLDRRYQNRQIHPDLQDLFDDLSK